MITPNVFGPSRSILPQGRLYVHVYGHSVRNHPDVHQQMESENEVCIYNGILLAVKKKETVTFTGK